MLPQGSKVTGLHAVISVDSPLAILWIVDNEIPTSHAFEQLSLVTMPLSYPIIILSVASQPFECTKHFSTLFEHSTTFPVLSCYRPNFI